jgi:ribonuclease P protein subunit RPR2
VNLLAGEGIRVVRSHHERWDGQGYPDQLTGDVIPPGARVFAVADALDAMTSDRPYRGALPWRVAVERLDAESSRQFDPQIVATFIAHEPRFRALHEQHESRSTSTGLGCRAS